MNKSDKSSRQNTPESNTIGNGSIRYAPQSNNSFTPSRFPQTLQVPLPSTTSPLVSRQTPVKPFARPFSISPTIASTAIPSSPSKSPSKQSHKKHMNALHDVLARLRKIRPLYAPSQKFSVWEDELKEYKRELKRKIMKVRKAKKSILESCGTVEKDIQQLKQTRREEVEHFNSQIQEERVQSNEPQVIPNELEINTKCEKLRQMQEQIQQKHEQIVEKQQRMDRFRQNSFKNPEEYSRKSNEAVAELKSTLDDLAKELYHADVKLKTLQRRPPQSSIRQSNIDSKIMQQSFENKKQGLNQYLSPLKLAIIVSIALIVFSFLF